MSEKDKEEIKVSEEKDGSVIVEVPESMLPADEQEEAPKEPVEAKAEESDEEDHPDDTDAVREARRARRKAKKEYIKKTNEEKDRRLEFLSRQNQELMLRLESLEKKSHVSDLARIEKAIDDEESRLNYAKLKMREATDNSDGNALIKAQEIWYDAKEKIDRLKGFKDQATRAEPNPQAAQPEVQMKADEWMSENPWYDPQGTDRNSRIAKQIDTQLVAEGWNPATDDYWEELTARLQQKLPNLYTDDIDETPRKRGPKSVVTGSERETGGGSSRSTFTLNPEQVRAMKDAGFWDDPKLRDKMIKRYASQARQNRS